MASNVLPRGFKLDEYLIESVLGEGGFGISYKAQDPKLGTTVVIKEYFPQSLAHRADSMVIVPAPGEASKHFEWGRQQFLNEVRALARFRHNHIVRVTRFLEVLGTAYMVMEFEAGQSLQDFLGRQPKPDERTLMQVFIPILNGLQAVHQAGLLHLDIKPENIFLRHDMTPLLIDFGSAKHVAQQADPAGIVALSPQYAAPEQFPPRGKLGPWTDMYSIGASLYRCVAGKEPVSANMRTELIKQGGSDPLEPLGSLESADYSSYLRQCIDWTMHLESARRPLTAMALQDALMGKGIDGRKPEPKRRPSPPPRPAAKAPVTPARSGMDSWKVVETPAVPVPEEPREPMVSGATIKRLVIAMVVLAAIGGGFFLVSSNPGLVNQVTRSLPAAGKVVDSARQAVTGQAPGEVRYVGGVDPASPEPPRQ